MRKILSIMLAVFSTALVACQQSDKDDNKPLDYDSLPVNFSASLDGQDWPEDATLGILATCTRNQAEKIKMSDNPVAKYRVSNGSLCPLTDQDKIIALKGDHNYCFVSIFPCPNTNPDVSNIPLSVPAVQQGADGIGETLTFIGTASALSVVPTIDLSLSTPFSILEFFIPDDIRDGLESTLTEMTVTIPDGDLTVSGSYNALTRSFTKQSSGDNVKITFPEGLPLKESFTKVRFVTAPFTIPEGGLQVVLKTTDGGETTISALSSEKEIGNEILAGETYSAYLSGTSDGIIPVQFPVIFPMGYPTAEPSAATEGYNNPTVATNTWVQEWASDPACVQATRLSTEWTGHHGTLYCMEQPQAYMTWNWSSEIATLGVNHFIETSNTVKSSNQYVNISTVGVKGVWTGDYYEFVIPVRKFAAGTTLCLKMAIYTRQGPTFWEVLYEDGGQWVSTAKDDLPAYPGAEVKARATWAIPYLAVTSTTDNEQSVNMTFQNAIPSGEIRIRVKCVDGSILSSGDNAVTTGNTKPYASGANASAPFYFYNPGKRNDQHIRIEMLCYGDST